MKQLQFIIIGILTIAVAVLYYLNFSTASSARKNSTNVQVNSKTAAVPGDVRVAYIDLDSVKEYYEFFKLKNEEIEREKNKIEGEIQGGLNKLEKDRIDFLKKGESITQIEAETFQRDYQNRYQQLGSRRETLLNQHLSNQAKALDEIQKKINDYLEEYNKTAKYNFIFSTGEGNLTLYYKDSTFNITNEIIKGLNNTYQQSRKK
jgi:outer membrane protein